MSAEQVADHDLAADLRRQQKELAAITAMVETVASTLDLPEVVNRTLASVLQVLDVSDGRIYLRNEHHELHQIAVNGMSATPLEGVAAPDAILALADQILRSGVAVLKRGSFTNQEDEREGGVAAAPLYSKGDILGVIVVVSPPPGQIGEAELRLLARLARHAGMAISNASLYRDLQQAYQALQDAQEQLVEAERQKTIMQMAGAAAHELNQPLTVVVGYSSILARSMPRDDSKYAIVEKIERNAQKMNEIVKRLGQLTQYKTREYLGGEHILDIRQDDESGTP